AAVGGVQIGGAADGDRVFGLETAQQRGIAQDDGALVAEVETDGQRQPRGGVQLDRAVGAQVQERPQVEVEVDRERLGREALGQVELDEQRVPRGVVRDDIRRQTEQRDQSGLQLLCRLERRSIAGVHQLGDIIGGDVVVQVVDEDGVPEEVGKLQDPVQHVTDQRQMERGVGVALTEIVQPTRDLREQADDRARVH